MYNSNGSTPAQMETANQYQVMRFITKDTQWCIWFTVSHDKHFKSHLFGHLVKRCKQLLWCLLVKCRVIQVLRCHAQEFGIEFFQPHFPFRKFVAKDLDVCNAKILHIHRNGHKNGEVSESSPGSRWLSEVPSPIPEPHIDLVVGPGPGSYRSPKLPKLRS